MSQLDLFSEAQIKAGLGAALDEIQPKHYKGSRPPQRSYEPNTFDKELFAFQWFSDYFGEKIYLKFVDMTTGPVPQIAIVSFHLDRPPTAKRRD